MKNLVATSRSQGGPYVCNTAIFWSPTRDICVMSSVFFFLVWRRGWRCVVDWK
jgi:hypothetical protein